MREREQRAARTPAFATPCRLSPCAICYAICRRHAAAAATRYGAMRSVLPPCHAFSLLSPAYSAIFCPDVP
jgi:hypothetical protein